MVTSRAIIATLISVTLVVTLWNLYFYSGTYMHTTPDTGTSRSFESLSSLTFTMEQLTTAKVPTMRVHLRNSAPKPFTVLTWNTPLDPAALNMAVFRVRDAKTNQIIQGPDVQVSRTQPPTRDAFVEVPASEEVTLDVPLTASWIPKSKLKISAHGRWHAVWEMKLKELSRSELEKMQNAMRDEFNVREAEFDLTPAKAHDEVHGAH